MKNWIIGIGILLVAALIWYLFLNPYDYRVNFRVRTFPGTVNQTIKSWGAGLDSAELVSQSSLLELTQRLSFNDSLHEYRWKISPLTDSTSKVQVLARDVKNSLANKLRIPFTDTDFEKRTRKTLLDFNEVLSEHIDRFRVKIIGEEELNGTYCAYVTMKGHQFDKARGMMYSSPLLGSILVENDVPLSGRPFLEVTHWDSNKDSIQFDFCYPIIRTANLPQHPELKYKRFSAKKAIKAVYNGNYITSDRAWYALLDYAQREGLQVTGLPVEVFHNNPNMGGDELQWTAEIFMPLKDTDD